MKRRIANTTWAFAVVIAGLCSVAPGAAAAVFQTQLDTLLPGGANAGRVTIDDARVSGFTFEAGGPVVVRPEDVSVRITSEPGYWGRVNVMFAYTRALPTAAGPASTIGVGYRLELGPSYGSMASAGLRFNGPVPSQGPGNSTAVVTQTLTNPNGTDLAPGAPVRPTESLDVFNDGPGRLADVNSEFLDLLPVTSLAVRNDVSVTPRAGTDQETAVWFVNTFLTVPEPAAAGLLPFAAAAALFRRRCRAA